jgi:hypothetical protein
MKKFLADSKMFEFDKFYRDCQKNKQPFLKAKKNPADDNYLIQMDIATGNKKIHLKTQKEIKLLFENEKIFLKGNKLESVFKGCNVNGETAWFDGVLPKRLDKFCETLFDLCSE